MGLMLSQDAGVFHNSSDLWLWGEPRGLLEAEALTLGEPNLLGLGGRGDPCSVGSCVSAT